MWRTCRSVTYEVMPGPNGVPSGMSAGAAAVTRFAQHGQVARNSSTRVVTGFIGGGSGRAYALARPRPASPRPMAHLQRPAERGRGAAARAGGRGAAPGPAL